MPWPWMAGRWRSDPAQPNPVGVELARELFKHREQTWRLQGCSVGQRVFQFRIIKVNTPATMPQKAEPTEYRVIPDAVTMKVMRAASRSFDSLMATVRPLLIEPNSASAAIDSTNSLGKAANNAASVAPNVPAMP